MLKIYQGFRRNKRIMAANRGVGAKRSQANGRLQAAGVDVLGFLIKSFKAEEDERVKREMAFKLLPYAHGTQGQINNKGEDVGATLSVTIGG